MRTNEEPDAKEIKRFWSKIWEQKVLNRNAEWINNMKKNYKNLQKVSRQTNAWITNSNIQESTKLENTRSWLYRWILVVKIHVHPEQSGSSTE